MAYQRAFKQYLQFNGLNLTSGLASEVKLNMNGEEIDVTVIGNNWKAYDQGQAEATLSASGVWDDGTAVTSLDAVMFGNLNQGGTKLWEYMPGGSVSNGLLYKGNGFVTSHEAGGAVGAKVGFASALRVAGSVTKTTAA